MGWAIGWDSNWNRDIGYGVPAMCDFPECSAEIDRGLAYVCGGQPYGGEEGCGLFFCPSHGGGLSCDRCSEGKPAYEAKPDVKEWIDFKETDPSWAEWRKERDSKNNRGV